MNNDNKNAYKKLLIVLNVLPLLMYGTFLIWVSSVGTGGEIILIAYMPILLAVTLAAAAIDVFYLLKFQIFGRQNSAAGLSIRIALLLISLAVAIYALMSLYVSRASEYEGGRRVSLASAVEEINKCNVYDISQDEVEVSMSLKTQKNEAAPPDYVTLEKESYGALVDAANNSSEKCGVVPAGSIEDSTINIQQALDVIRTCQVQLIEIPHANDEGSELTLHLKNEGTQEDEPGEILYTSADHLDSVMNAVKSAEPQCGLIEIDDFDV